MASDAVRIARLSASTQLTSQALGVVTDPVWSTILGFVVVHELRKQDLVGPVADDLLYAGLIAINCARTGVAQQGGRALGLENVILPAAVVAVGAKVLSSTVKTGGAAVAGAAGSLLPVAGVAALAAGGTYAGLKLTKPKNPLWKQLLGRAIGGPPTNLYRAWQGANRRRRKK